MSNDEGNAGSEGSGEALFKGVAKHSLIYGVGMLVSRAVSFVMLPIYLQFLTPADYGVMFLVEMTLDFVAIIGGAQLALGVFRFYHKTDDEEEKKLIVSTSFLLVGMLYLLIGTATFLAAEPLSSLIFGNASHALVIRIASANLAANALVVVPLSFARVRDMSRMYVGVNVGKLLLAVFFNILFIIVLGMGVVGIFLSSFISNAVIGIGLASWLLRTVGGRWSWRWTRDLLRYGVPLMGMQVATFVATFSDRYFLQAAADETLVGLYGLAYQFGFLLVVVGFSPIDMVWGPKRFDIARGDDPDPALASGFLFMNVALLSVAVGIVLYVGDVLRVMADPEFHPAAAVVPVILVAYVLQCWASVQDIGILVQERTRYLAIANVAAAGVALGGYAVLVPRYLEWGAAAATVLSFATRYVLTYIFSQRFWPVRYRWRPVWIAVAWATAVCVVAISLPDMGIVPSVAVRTGMAATFFLGLWLLPILDPAERATARGLGTTLLRATLRRGT